jgi:hypothetical protein
VVNSFGELRYPVGVDGEKYFVRVAFAMNKSDKESTRFSTQDILKNTGAQVVTQFVAESVLTILQRTGITETFDDFPVPLISS